MKTHQIQQQAVTEVRDFGPKVGFLIHETPFQNQFCVSVVQTQLSQRSLLTKS